MLQQRLEEAAEQSAVVTVGGLTDNIRNRFAMAGLLGAKWPLAAFVAELAAQLETKSVLLQFAWVPIYQNAAADAARPGPTPARSRHV